jgi:hypothetical protein
MGRRNPFVLALLAAAGGAAPAGAFKVVDLDFPTKVAYHAPSRTLFIAQKAGVINAFGVNSTTNISTPVLDISAGECAPAARMASRAKCLQRPCCALCGAAGGGTGVEGAAASG